MSILMVDSQLLLTYSMLFLEVFFFFLEPHVSLEKQYCSGWMQRISTMLTITILFFCLFVGVYVC